MNIVWLNGINVEYERVEKGYFWIEVYLVILILIILVLLVIGVFLMDLCDFFDEFLEILIFEINKNFYGLFEKCLNMMILWI